MTTNPYETAQKRTFDGTYTDDTLIADGTDPWVEIDGKIVDWATPGRFFTRPPNDCDACTGSIVPGVIAPMNTPIGIQRCDECNVFKGDLDAALALAKLVGGEVKYWARPE